MGTDLFVYRHTFNDQFLLLKCDSEKIIAKDLSIPYFCRLIYYVNCEEKIRSYFCYTLQIIKLPMSEK